MTSVPLGFWPYNVASLGWVIVVVVSLCNELLGEQLTVYGVILGISIFVVDALILGPMWYFMVNRRK